MSAQQPSSRFTETRKFFLAERMIERGARPPTIHKLTGLPEVTIRRLYTELLGKSPVRGPSSYSYLWFTEVPKRQLAASLAGTALRHFIADRWNDQPGEFLGEAYIDAFDFFKESVKQWRHYGNEISFERFASLGSFLAKRNPLDFHTCSRCPRSFVAQIYPQDGIPQTVCPVCLIMQSRECVHCGNYVELEFGDFPPARAPCCISCACSEQRITTLEVFLASKEIYPSNKYDEFVPRARDIVERLRSLSTPGRVLSRCDPDSEADSACA